MRVVVVGGTGLVGRALVAALKRRRSGSVGVAARSTGVDVRNGRGLDEALRGADVVVDVSNVATTRRAEAVGFFTESTDRLVRAGERAGVSHHVVLSIVGVDRVDSGYYAGKLAQEERALAGQVPVTVLRATQFHEFAGQLLERTRRGRLAVLPRMRVQPVAAVEVARALAAIAIGPAVGRAPDLGGPQVHELPDLARRLLVARSEQIRVVGVRLPGSAGRSMARGGLLLGPDGRVAGPTFDAWLAAAPR